MTILDANVLLYAYNADAPQQRPVARWLEKQIGNGEMMALPWVTIWAFVRITTNPRLWLNPQPARKAFAIIREWLAQPGVILLNPGPLHAEILERLVSEHNASGPLLTDAVLAALAVEHGASLASTDQDFRRFPDIRWINPLSV